jgi:hypothetical protein
MLFLTFTNTSYSGADRILQQARDFKIFDKIIHKSEFDIPEFVNKHSEFISKNPHGYGRFIWKPKIILDTLLTMNDGEILLYCDSGVHLNTKGLPRFHEYLSYLKKDDVSMVSFCTSDYYKPHYFVKQDAIQYYYPEFNSLKDIKCCYAGIILFKKNSKSISLLSDWLNLCENYHFLDNSISILHKETKEFKGQDGDNGLFMLVKAKHKIHYDITPDETNLYDKNGVQLAHVDFSTDPNNWDWSSLDSYPIHCRRDRLRIPTARPKKLFSMFSSKTFKF